jgi:hypothetical protein
MDEEFSADEQFDENQWVEDAKRLVRLLPTGGLYEKVMFKFKELFDSYKKWKNSSQKEEKIDELVKIAYREGTTEEVLGALAVHPEPLVRFAAVESNRLPVTICDILRRHDPDSINRSEAARKLKIGC